MILADDIFAARGSEIDAFGTITSISAAIQSAERFILSDEVAIAAYQLIGSKPASLLSAMPMCRLPYPKVWIEWRGGVAEIAGWNLYPSCETGIEGQIVKRKNPIRMGCLLEASDNTGQRGQMTFAWIHKSGEVNVCPLAVNFDWSDEGDVNASARAAGLGGKGDALTATLYRRWIESNETITDAEIIDLMKTRHTGWQNSTRDQNQIDAVRALMRHEAVWLSKHAVKFFAMCMEFPDFHRLVMGWEGDITGEAPYVGAFIMMLNSRNALERKPNDVTKLNKARAKRGAAPFLSHDVTHLYVSAARRRAAAASGISHEAARWHMVRGHFKIRKSGVYWWSPFTRGDSSRPITERKRYEAR